MDGENNGKPYEQMDDLGVPIIFGHTHVNFNSNEPKKRLSCCRWSTAASTRTWFPNLATPDPQGNTTVPACCLKTNRISPKTSARKKTSRKNMSNCQLQGLPTWSRLMDCSAKSRNWLLSNHTENTWWMVFFKISGGVVVIQPPSKNDMNYFCHPDFSSASGMIHGFNLNKKTKENNMGRRKSLIPLFWGAVSWNGGWTPQLAKIGLTLLKMDQKTWGLWNGGGFQNPPF